MGATHIPTQTNMGTRNISISDEAYQRLASLKRPNESFTDVINRLTGRRSILELTGVLTEAEAEEIRVRIQELRSSSRARISATLRRMHEE